MGDINYLFERLEILEVFEEGYGPSLPITELTISKKALKQMSKNPNINQLYSKATTFSTQLLKATSSHGIYSFAIGSLRGLGDKSEANTYTLNWIGTHEDYNKEKSPKN
jgi:hypothetical protein